MMTIRELYDQLEPFVKNKLYADSPVDVFFISEDYGEGTVSDIVGIYPGYDGIEKRGDMVFIEVKVRPK